MYNSAELGNNVGSLRVTVSSVSKFPKYAHKYIFGKIC